LFKTSKGAPHVLLKLVGENVSEDIKRAVERDVHTLGERGIRCLAVAKTESGSKKWMLLGLLTFLDPPRPDTKKVFIFNFKVFI
jgi:H+-transporting ATPase